METSHKFSKFNKNWFEEPVFIPHKVNYHYDDRNYQIWTGKVGDGNKLPLLILHGGPGRSHSNLVVLQALGFEREVYFYDQLGCGYSDKPDDLSLWNIDRYVEEVNTVVKGLDLNQYHLLGHSWGTTLATSFSYKYPQGIVSLTLHSPILDFPKYIKKSAPVLKSDLSGNNAYIIDAFELKNQGDIEEYKVAIMDHLKKHVCKLFPNPPEPLIRLNHLEHPQVHDVMVGKTCNSELNILGNLKDVDISNYISEIDMPVLFTCGQYDLCTPDETNHYCHKAKNGSYYEFFSCMHMTMLESPVEFLNITHTFIRQNES
jgi:proline iminopeptidase